MGHEDGYAEPVTATVKAIQKILWTLLAHPLLAPAFIREAVICHPNDQLREVAQRMASGDVNGTRYRPGWIFCALQLGQRDASRRTVVNGTGDPTSDQS